MFTKEKNPALAAFGKIGGRLRNAKLKKKLGLEAYRQHFSDLARKRWTKNTPKQNARKSAKSAEARGK